MYVPKIFELNDREAIAAVLADYPFAVLVTPGMAPGPDAPTASHLPLMYRPDPGPGGRLLGHLARANGQCRDLAAAAEGGREVLAVFQGPHAYISPNDYGPGPATVPTWNYLAVHAYGVPRLIDDAGETAALVTALTARQEADRDPPWSPEALDDGFFKKRLRGVQAFEIPIARLEAKAKLSQNREPAQAAHAAGELERSDDSLVRETGRHMRAALSGPSGPPGGKRS